MQTGQVYDRLAMQSSAMLRGCLEENAVTALIFRNRLKRTFEEPSTSSKTSEVRASHMRAHPVRAAKCVSAKALNLQRKDERPSAGCNSTSNIISRLGRKQPGPFCLFFRRNFASPSGLPPAQLPPDRPKYRPLLGDYQQKRSRHPPSDRLGGAKRGC